MLAFMIGINGAGRTLLKTFIWIMFIISAAGIFTVIIRFGSFLAGNFDFYIDTDGYGSPNGFLLPAALFYGQSYYFNELNLTLPRFVGGFREPGLMQAFGFTALLCVQTFYRGGKAILMQCVLGLASLLTLSTAAFVNFPIVLILLALQTRFGIKIRIVIVFLFTVMAVAFATYTYSLSSVGLSAKLDGESGQDRTNAIRDAERTFNSHPFFGSVIANDSNLESSVSGSLLIVYSRYGFLGMLFLFSPFAYLCLRRGFLPKFILLSPLIITAITSQPLFNTVPVLFLLFTVATIERPSI